MIPIPQIAIPQAVLHVVKAGWKFVAGAIIAAPLIFGLGRCSGAADERTKMTAKAVIKSAPATAKAADERLTDDRAVNNKTQELRNAVAKTPDAKPDAVSMSLQCKRILLAGRALPPACR